MFKKIIAISLALILAAGCFLMAGCGGDNEEDNTGELTVEQQIETADLLYPDKNSEFRYNKYTYYIEITQCLSTKSNITIPDTIDNLPVYVIADKAFQNQTTIKTVSISNNVVKIGNYAFGACSQLTSVKLSESLTTLGEYAFSECPLLRSIELPNTLIAISANAFSKCDSLSYVIIEDAEVISVNEETGEETLSAARTVYNNAFSECPNLKYVWIASDCAFGEKGDADPFYNSLENLTIYGYSQSDAARYAASKLVDFVLVQNKSQLVEFKSTARNASQIQSIGKDDEFKGAEYEISVEDVYIVRNTFAYYTVFVQEREEVINEFTYTPDMNTVVAVFGVRVKNNTSKAMNFNTLTASISVDSYAGRFANFGRLNNTKMNKYASPTYTTVNPGETVYLHFASIISSDWEEIVINFGSYGELINYNFTVKSTDTITYIGSADAALDDEDITNINNEETTNTEDVSNVENEESSTNINGENTEAVTNEEESQTEFNVQFDIPSSEAA